MAKYANAGELRTPIKFIRIDRTNDSDGYPTETEVDVFGQPVMCAWVNVHGNEVFTAMQIIADGAETEITVEYTTIPVDAYINAAKSKARVAGIPAFENNAQYDLFIMALAAMYYDNRGMTFQNPADADNAKQMIDSFVLSLRYATEDPSQGGD